jgi:heat shock protein HspQ
MSDAAAPVAAGSAAPGVCDFRYAKFKIGDVVRHRVFPFRGVVFDVDPVFDNTEEWLASIPADVRPDKDQPFYHLLAENADTTYVAYVSEQNLLHDESGRPCRHPLLREMFMSPKRGVYRMKAMKTN